MAHRLQPLRRFWSGSAQPVHRASFWPPCIMEATFQRAPHHRNPGTDEVKAFCRKLAVTTNGIPEEGITTITMISPLSRYGLRESIAASVPAPAFTINRMRRGVSRDSPNSFHRIVRNQFLPDFGNHFFRFLTGTVENRYGITTAFDVERKVAPHHCHTDDADLLL